MLESAAVREPVALERRREGLVVVLVPVGVAEGAQPAGARRERDDHARAQTAGEQVGIGVEPRIADARVEAQAEAFGDLPTRRQGAAELLHVPGAERGIGRLVIARSEGYAEALRSHGIDRDSTAPDELGVALVRGQAGEIVAAVERHVRVVCDASVGLEVEAARGRGDALEHEARAARAVAVRVVVDRAREQVVTAAAVAPLEPHQAREQPGLAAQLGADLGSESKVRLCLLRAPLRLERETEEQMGRAGRRILRQRELQRGHGLCGATQLEQQAPQQQRRLGTVIRPALREQRELLDRLLLVFVRRELLRERVEQIGIVGVARHRLGQTPERVEFRAAREPGHQHEHEREHEARDADQSAHAAPRSASASRSSPSSSSTRRNRSTSAGSKSSPRPLFRRSRTSCCG